MTSIAWDNLDTATRERLLDMTCDYLPADCND